MQICMPIKDGQSCQHEIAITFITGSRGTGTKTSSERDLMFGGRLLAYLPDVEYMVRSGIARVWSVSKRLRSVDMSRKLLKGDPWSKKSPISRFLRLWR